MFPRLAALVAAGLVLGAAAPRPPVIVAAESVWGDVARQVAGPGVRVVSLLASPAVDPHDFEAPPSAARALAEAGIVVVNGLGYDGWATALLAARQVPGRVVLEAGALAGRHPGDNPHLWYDPGAVAAVARAMAAALPAVLPGGARLPAFLAATAALEAELARLRRSAAGLPVAATEPVADDLLARAGLEIRDRDFARAVMNGTEPAASAVAALEHDLRARAVRLLVVNGQVTTPLTARMREIAAAAGVPVLAVSETEPPDLSYQAWMGGVIAGLRAALGLPP